MAFQGLAVYTAAAKQNGIRRFMQGGFDFQAVAAVHHGKAKPIYTAPDGAFSQNRQRKSKVLSRVAGDIFDKAPKVVLAKV